MSNDFPRVPMGNPNLQNLKTLITKTAMEGRAGATMNEHLLRELIARAVKEGRDQDARELAKQLPPVEAPKD